MRAYYFNKLSTICGCGRGIIEVDVTSPLIPNFARHALTADLTEDTSPVITKYPLPPKPLALLHEYCQGYVCRLSKFRLRVQLCS